MTKRTFVAVALSIVGWCSLVEAQSVLVLKNGRQITVQSYRMEGSMIRFTGLGGEIAIPKDQIQAILKPGESDRPGLNVTELESSRPPATVPPKPTPTPTREATQTPSPKETTSISREEEKDYQKRLADTSQKLETAQQEYLNATQGGGSSSNVSREGLQGWIADFGSRIRDSQKVPGGGPPAGTPPMEGYENPVYTPRQKELSDKRIQIDILQKERDSLIQEMKSKNIPAGTF
jgi:hypothetical protein